MTGACETLHRRLTVVAGRELAIEREPELRAHLAECPVCREQWVAHRVLRGLRAEAEPPAPRAELPALVRSRSSRRPRGGSRWRRVALAGYWLAAAVTTSAILMRIPWVRVDSTWLLAGAASLLLLGLAGIDDRRLVAWLDGFGSRFGLDSRFVAGSRRPSQSPPSQG